MKGQKMQWGNSNYETAVFYSVNMFYSLTDWFQRFELPSVPTAVFAPQMHSSQKIISRKAEKNENPLKRPSSLWIGIYNSFSASSQVSAALLGLSKSMYTNIIATVTTVTATPRHTGLTSWNHWTIKAGKDLLDHCVQLLPKRPNPPCLGTNTDF